MLVQVSIDGTLADQFLPRQEHMKELGLSDIKFQSTARWQINSYLRSIK